MPRAKTTPAPAAAAETPVPELDPVEPEKAVEEPKPKATKVPYKSILSTGAKLDEKPEYVNMLAVGDQGTGKTTDLLMLANLGPVIVLNTEAGVKRGALRRMGVNTDNITVLPEKPEDLTFKYMEDLYWELAAKLSEDPDYIAGVVWDSITEIHKRLLRNVVDYQLKRATAKGESRIKSGVAGDMLNESFTDLSDYGIMTDQMRTLLRRYRDLPCHFGISALMRRDIDDDGKVVYNPAVTPGLQNDLVGWMDIITVKQLKEFADDGDDEYQGLTRPAGKFRGKDRFKVLPKYLVDPFFDRVVRYVNEDLTTASDPIMVAAYERRGIQIEAAAAQAEAAAEG